ncbi:MAG: hypothetical protein ACRDJC_26925 [Thermomicrobiales bacterium]
MTTRSDYTDAEWELLTDLPRMAAFGAMAAEEGGPVTSTRELWAGMKELAQSAQSRYPDNALIQEVSRAIAQNDNGAEMTRSDWNPNSGEKLGEVIIEQTLEAAPKVREILASSASPEEAADYAAWVLGIARAGCEAVRTGLFGLSGEKLTAREAAFVQELSAALGAS